MKSLLRIGIIKQTTFLFVFSTYLLVFLLKFQAGELVGCIERVHTLHTFNEPRYTKKNKHLKKRDDGVIITFFRYFLFLGQRCPSEVCSVSTRWMRNLTLHPTSPLTRNLSKKQGNMLKIRTKEVVFFNDKYVNSTIMVDLFY